ncbi:MAG TPA: DUF4399 domain-containing protein [Burkholderiales bacterium]|nr:DUF4399 domain-containing protein [Burkholderiales bacterium]
MKITAAFALVLVTGLASSLVLAQVPKSKSAEGAKVYFIEPRDGATVEQEFTVKFGLSGMGVAPAGADFENTGHHHLLVDGATADMNAPIPADATHIHFGRGQTEAKVKLPPGQHTLQLLLGDKNHIPHDKPVMSEKISVTVK